MPPGRRSEIGSELGDWHRRMPGSLVLDAENDRLAGLIANVFGYHLLLVGSGDYLSTLDAARVQHRTWLTAPPPLKPDPGSAQPLPCCSAVCGLASAMPVASDSIDVVVLPHVIEFEDTPHGALRETERVLVPEGHVIMAGYNSLGLMGAWNLLPHRARRAPWNGRFYTMSRVRDWLRNLGFDMVASEGCFFRPPLRSGRALRRLQVFETAGPKFWPYLCGTWFLVARKRTATLTPGRPARRRRRRPIRSAGLAGSAMTTGRRARFPAAAA